MKLLTAPGWTQETVESDGGSVPFIETHTSFNPLGLLGIGPVFKTRRVRTVRSMPSMRFPGRSCADAVEIDFEDADARSVTLIPDYGHYAYTPQNRDGFVLAYGPKQFRFYNILPHENLRDNVWRCSVSHFVELEDGRVD